MIASFIPAYNQEKPTGTQRYIVRFKDSLSGAARRLRLSRYPSAQRMENFGIAVVDASPAEIENLRSIKDVEFVVEDHSLTAKGDLVADTINASVAWQSTGASGAGIGVAVIDSGINATVQDMGNSQGQNDPRNLRIVYAENFLVPATDPAGHPNPNRYKTNDGFGHGTHVAGLIAGNGFVSRQAGSIQTFTGMAPGANLIDLQVLDSNGQGSDSNVIAAIDRAIGLRTAYNIRVINLSLGRQIYSSFAQDPMCRAVEAAWQAGIVVVVAAGNEGRNMTYGGYGTIDSPGNDPMVLTVGAMRTAGTPTRADDEITTYSSRGPTAIDHIVKPDIVAPGNLVSSTLSPKSFLAVNYPQDIVDPLAVFNPNLNTAYEQSHDPSKLPPYYRQASYLTLSGTSMAAAVTSGAVALLLSVQPSLTPDQVKARLMLTSSKNFTNFGPFYFTNTTKIQQLNQQIQDLEVFSLASDQIQVAPQQNQLNQANAQVFQATAAVASAAIEIGAADLTVDAAILKYPAISTAENAYRSAEKNDVQLKIAVTQAQAQLQTDQNAEHSAHDAANQALQSLTQAQNQLNNAQNNAQNDLAQAQRDLGKPPYQQDMVRYKDDLAAITALQGQVSTLQSQYSSLQQQDNTLLAAVASDQTALTNAQNSSTAADQTLNTARNTLQQAEASLSPAGKPVVDNANNLLVKGENDLQTANNQLANAKQQLAQAQAQFNAVAGQLFADQATLAQLRAELASLRAVTGIPTAPYVSQYDIFTVGAGYLDINAAILSGVTVPEGASAVSPVAYYDSGSSSYQITSNYASLCSGPTVQQSLWGAAICGNDTVWGTHVLWGTGTVWGDHVLWGTTSVWGSSVLVSGSNAIWGTNAVWGTSGTSAYNTLWSTHVLWGTGGTFGSATDAAASDLRVLVDGDLRP